MGKRNRRSSELPSALYCDASYLIAYFAPADQYHKRALKMRARLFQKEITLYTSWPTISEASTLLLYHYGYSHAMALFQAIRAFQILSPRDMEFEEATALFKEFNRDQKLSFNDILTYVIVRDRLHKIPVLTFDRDFAKMGLTLFI